jgi:hypothetical protein
MCVYVCVSMCVSVSVCVGVRVCARAHEQHVASSPWVQYINRDTFVPKLMLLMQKAGLHPSLPLACGHPAPWLIQSLRR